MVRVVVKYLEVNPERLHKDPYWESLEAIHTAYPCEQPHENERMDISGHKPRAVFDLER